MHELGRLTKLVDLTRNDDVHEAVLPQQILVFVKAAEEQRVIALQAGDAVCRNPEIVPGHMAIATGPAVAAKRRRISFPFADELAGLEGLLVVDLLDTSGEKPLSRQ